MGFRLRFTWHGDRVISEKKLKTTIMCRYWGLLGGPWDLATTYNWDHDPTYSWGNPYKPSRGIIIRVISPGISTY